MGPTLLVDIGSASVGACIAENAEGNIVVSHVKRVSLVNVSGQNTAGITALALDALKKCLAGFERVSPAARSAHAVLAAPWYSARLKTISIAPERPVRMDKGTVEKALHDYQEQHVEDLLAGTRRMESSVSQAYVNGYPTALLEPVMGKDLTLNVYESEADAVFLAGIEEAIRAAFAGVQTTFHSFPYAAFAVFRAYRDEQSFIIVDVGGEITDIAIVNRDGLFFLGSFPLGTLTLLRSIAGQGSIADAASRLSLYARSELSAEEEATFGALFVKARQAWSGEYRKLLENAVLEAPVPNTTFLIADKEELKWFERVLTEAESPFPIRPIIVTPDFFQSVVSLGQEGSYESFLSIAALNALAIKTESYG